MPVARYFISLFLLLGLLYAALLLGSGSNAPRLGLDLRGGTTVTLRALTEDGDPPTAQDLQVARQIIEDRVNGLGVASAEVTTEGDRNIVISVPGEGGEQVKQLGATALLELRPVVMDPTTLGAPPSGGDPSATGEVAPADPNAPADPTATADPNAPADPNAAADPNAPSTGQPTAAGEPQPTEQTANARPVPPLAQTETPTAEAPATDAPATDAPATDVPGSGGAAEAPTTGDPAAPNPTESAAPTQSIPVGAATAEEAAAIAAQLDCTVANLNATPPTADQYMAACGPDGKYVLGPVLIKGTQVKDASSGYDTQTGQGWIVSVEFDNEGSTTWADYTGANVGARVAFTLDQRVLTAPVIQQRISGPTQITGSFTQESATTLANSLKYGALPLTFTQSEARTVSATLGQGQLQAGLIAGAIGVGLVVIYCLLYYRVLGIVTIFSLALSAALVYAVLVLLGRGIGLTLTLSGIAGFIVAIGITADSFVVFFERLKDEVREGRSMRSAVPRAWSRAKRTILSADAVSFLAAAILYFLTVGEVKGFAFTLGLSTVLDLVIVFLFTHPIVSWLSRFSWFSSPLVSGLGRGNSAPIEKRPAPLDRARPAKKKVTGAAASASAKERAQQRRAALKEG